MCTNGLLYNRTTGIKFMDMLDRISNVRLVTVINCPTTSCMYSENLNLNENAHLTFATKLIPLKNTAYKGLNLRVVF